MARLIDADSAVKAISRLAEDMSINDRAVALLLALELNNEDRFPTADVVEVVRCKECKFYVEHSLFGATQGWCERLCDEFDRSMARGTENDDFCSHGEKKVEV